MSDRTVTDIEKTSRFGILLAEDDLVCQKLIRNMLERFGYDVETAGDGKEAFERIRESDIRLLITDWTMPEMEGPDLCRRIREEIRDRYVFIILLTARSDKSDLISGIEAGADDYLVKPFEPDELRVRLRAGERIITLERDLHEAQKRLTTLAYHDSLTGLLNRRALFERLSEEMERARRLEHSPLSVIIFDIDHFKNINDTHGHIVGDKVLAAVANRAKSMCRSYDVLGRYGGEEFLFVLPGADLAAGEFVAERVRRALESEPVVTDPEPIRLTASFGVGQFSPDLHSNPDSILRPADEALYRAKREGRNRVCVS
ncbi:MAG: diguanylate cyclase [bacterium]